MSTEAMDWAWLQNSGVPNANNLLLYLAWRTRERVCIPRLTTKKHLKDAVKVEERALRRLISILVNKKLIFRETRNGFQPLYAVAGEVSSKGEVKLDGERYLERFVNSPGANLDEMLSAYFREQAANPLNESPERHDRASVTDEQRHDHASVTDEQRHDRASVTDEQRHDRASGGGKSLPPSHLYIKDLKDLKPPLSPPEGEASASDQEEARLQAQAETEEQVQAARNAQAKAEEKARRLEQRFREQERKRRTAGLRELIANIEEEQAQAPGDDLQEEQAPTEEQLQADAKVKAKLKAQFSGLSLSLSMDDDEPPPDPPAAPKPKPEKTEEEAPEAPRVEDLEEAGFLTDSEASATPASKPEVSKPDQTLKQEALGLGLGLEPLGSPSPTPSTPKRRARSRRRTKKTQRPSPTADVEEQIVAFWEKLNGVESDRNRAAHEDRLKLVRARLRGGFTPEQIKRALKEGLKGEKKRWRDILSICRNTTNLRRKLDDADDAEKHGTAGGAHGSVRLSMREQERLRDRERGQVNKNWDTSGTGTFQKSFDGPDDPLMSPPKPSTAVSYDWNSRR